MPSCIHFKSVTLTEVDLTLPSKAVRDINSIEFGLPFACFLKRFRTRPIIAHFFLNQHRVDALKSSRLCRHHQRLAHRNMLSISDHMCLKLHYRWLNIESVHDMLEHEALLYLVFEIIAGPPDRHQQLNSSVDGQLVLLLLANLNRKAYQGLFSLILVDWEPINCWLLF